MENDFDSSMPDGDSARDALSALNADGARLAQSVITPWWYHPILGVIVAMMIVGVAYPGILGFAFITIGIVGVTLLVRAYTQHTGVWISQAAGPATRQLMRVLAVVYIVLMGAALALRVTEPSLWWVTLPALSAFWVTWVLGRYYDRELRRELAASGTGA